MFETSREDRLVRHGPSTDIVLLVPYRTHVAATWWLRKRKNDLPGVYMVKRYVEPQGEATEVRFSHAVAAMAFKLRWG